LGILQNKQQQRPMMHLNYIIEPPRSANKLHFSSIEIKDDTLVEELQRQIVTDANPTLTISLFRIEPKTAITQNRRFLSPILSNIPEAAIKPTVLLKRL